MSSCPCTKRVSNAANASVPQGCGTFQSTTRMPTVRIKKAAKATSPTEVSISMSAFGGWKVTGNRGV